MQRGTIGLCRTGEYALHAARRRARRARRVLRLPIAASGSRTYSACTICNTLTEPVHCIVWAKYLFKCAQPTVHMLILLFCYLLILFLCAFLVKLLL